LAAVQTSKPCSFDRQLAWALVLFLLAQHFAISRHASPAWRFFVSLSRSPLFELASLLVRLGRVARFIVNANHGIMCVWWQDIET
jgi:hypothetical protein